MPRVIAVNVAQVTVCSDFTQRRAIIFVLTFRRNVTLPFSGWINGSGRSCIHRHQIHLP